MAQCRHTLLGDDWVKVILEKHFLGNYVPTLDSIQIREDLISHKVGSYGKGIGSCKNGLLELTTQSNLVFENPLSRDCYYKKSYS